jgi:hypothetical protein
MTHSMFAVLILLPSMALCFVILSSLYGWVNAYASISWVPLALFAIIYLFLQMDYQQYIQTTNLKLLFEAFSWTSLIQGLLGVAITVRASLVKENWILAAIATLLTALPFFLAG